MKEVKLDMHTVHYSSNSNEWETPQWLFDELNDEFNFTLDPCCTHENAKCSNHFTKAEDGLMQSWEGETVFCNPPYGKEQTLWIRKCYHESRSPHTLVVALIPARTDTVRFHDYINGYAEIRFIKGRLKFSNSKQSAPFPSMLVVWR